MKLWLFQIMFNIRYSYWFIPGAMSVGAIMLAAGLVATDIYLMPDIPPSWEWLFNSNPDGARALLSTVAGSTITVAGVVFSMTILSVSHATANYGSRLLLRFLEDRRNQFTLGMFTATFIYCLLVLRTVSSGDGNQATDFVPHLAILMAVTLSVISVAVLIAFIHHVPDTIHIGEVTADRGKTLIGRLEHLFPNTTPPQSADLPINPDLVLGSKGYGYIQAMDIEGILKYATRSNLCVTARKGPGQFVSTNESLFEVAGEFEDRDTVRDRLSGFYNLGAERTPTQDVRFLIEELVQIAARALSPGINDPYTANTCMDWLGNGVAASINQTHRGGALMDEDGRIRVRVPTFTFVDLCESIFSSMRPYATTDYNATRHMAKVFQSILDCANEGDNKQCVLSHARAFLTDALDQHTSTRSRDEIRRAYTQFNTNHDSTS
ncbi:hypothetical protein GCM10008090_23770 [Arenicella chitinivorans]|uniref:DUF2254 domain-containing protein n=1 Tax=Arenicella chitinivorans TaxID=1329800 RepID=A0A918RW39_9GAMM|nr:DUF2254 domain-containing protein [Arenicella chitinivorans]GHA13292.1 hypothetical protein GCM10008090_23770 [Arenicella chitinivorans]